MSPPCARVTVPVDLEPHPAASWPARCTDMASPSEVSMQEVTHPDADSIAPSLSSGRLQCAFRAKGQKSSSSISGTRPGQPRRSRSPPGGRRGWPRSASGCHRPSMPNEVPPSRCRRLLGVAAQIVRAHLLRAVPDARPRYPTTVSDPFPARKSHGHHDARAAGRPWPRCR